MKAKQSHSGHCKEVGGMKAGELVQVAQDQGGVQDVQLAEGTET